MRCLSKVQSAPPYSNKVNVDLVGPLPSSHGFTYLFTMVDRMTCWPEAVPLSSTSASNGARAFIGTWVARFGTLSDLSSDRGSQFTSELWNAMAEGLGVKLHRTTAYHPQANGLCERFHHSIKAALRASLKDGDWVDKLPWVMLGLRCAPKEDLQSSLAELVYGQALRVPALVGGQTTFLPPGNRQGSHVSTRHPRFPHTPLRAVDYVFIRHKAHRGPLRPPYNGPFRVLRHGNKCLVVDVGGRPETVSLDRVKPANVDVSGSMAVAQLLRLPRPC